MRVAAIDCGTNSIRLLIADVVEGRLRDVHREMRIVTLGEGVDATGQFAPAALARTGTKRTRSPGVSWPSFQRSADVTVTRLDSAINWLRTNSMWPMPMGLACCAIELMATASSRFDIARFGMERFSATPRQVRCS